MSTVIAWTERTVIRQRATESIVRHFDWTDWLVSPAQLASATWVTSDAALVIDNDSVTASGQYATFRLRGGVAGATYTITCTVVSNESPTQTGVKSVTVEIAA